MGLAASQGRLLLLTSRKDDVEGQLMRIANQKLSLSRQAAKISQQYNNDLNAVKAVWTDANGNPVTSTLTYDSLMDYSKAPYLGANPTDPAQQPIQYILERGGKVVLSGDLYNKISAKYTQSGHDCLGGNGTAAFNTFMSAIDHPEAINQIDETYTHRYIPANEPWIYHTTTSDLRYKDSDICNLSSANNITGFEQSSDPVDDAIYKIFNDHTALYDTGTDTTTTIITTEFVWDGGGQGHDATYTQTHTMDVSLRNQVVMYDNKIQLSSVNGQGGGSYCYNTTDHVFQWSDSGSNPVGEIAEALRGNIVTKEQAKTSDGPTRARIERAAAWARDVTMKRFETPGDDNVDGDYWDSNDIGWDDLTNSGITKVDNENYTQCDTFHTGLFNWFEHDVWQLDVDAVRNTFLNYFDYAMSATEEITLPGNKYNYRGGSLAEGNYITSGNPSDIITIATGLANPADGQVTVQIGTLPDGQHGTPVAESNKSVRNGQANGGGSVFEHVTSETNWQTYHFENGYIKPDTPYWIKCYFELFQEINEKGWANYEMADANALAKGFRDGVGVQQVNWLNTDFDYPGPDHANIGDPSGSSSPSSPTGFHFELKKDEAQVDEAKANYDYQKDLLDSREARLDVMMNNLDTERSAITTEISSVQGIINKNIERSFKMFQA